jgi:glycosyltransferase involved in cell wall biosynthesis
MRGLGIRCWELAHSLAAAGEITIAHAGTSEGVSDGVGLVPYLPHSPGALRPLLEQANTVVAHPQWPAVNRLLRRSTARIVVDLYDPETLETLELFAGAKPWQREQRTALTLDRLHAALRVGHNFVCASETQRDLWLGVMLGLRMITPSAYDADPSMREVIDLVPFGLPASPPEPSAAGAVRRAIPALGEDSEIVLWNGGIWRWLDAATPIRAVAALAQRRPQVRLVFMGAAAEHPAARASTEQARRLATELGVLDTVVHFHEGWVPYEHRAAWLADAACAVSAHSEHLETRFAYRTRLLDCLWAGVPIVCTEGDDLAREVASEHLGAVVSPGDERSMGAALEEVLDAGRASYAGRLREAAARHTWEQASAPLARWISAPAPSSRPADAAGVVRAPLAQRVRELAYRLGGSAALARVAARRGR